MSAESCKMKKLISTLAILLACGTAAWAAEPVTLTSLRDIAALSNADAERKLPVAFEATVTYFRDYESTLFVQDDGKAIYVFSARNLSLSPGDRVLIRGTTAANFLPLVISDSITVLRHSTLPKPVPATFAEMIQGRLDCMYVSVRGVIRSADVQLSAGRHVTQLEVSMKGGYVGVTMDNGDPARLSGWLDSEVEVTGVSAGRFDGKMQQTGVLLHVTSYEGVRILHQATQDPWSIPVTPMNKVLTGFDVDEQTPRVRIEGTITYYRQTEMAVLQDGSQSIRVLTPEVDPLRVGDRAEAIGVPFVDNGFLTIKMGAIRSTGIATPIVPVPVTWDELASSKHAFDLVSIEGTVESQVQEQAQDVYIIRSQDNLFSATVRHPFVYEWGVVKPPPPMPWIAPGSKVRVTGVAILDDGNPFNGTMAFGILLRSADDVAVIASPSWLNVRNLTRIIIVLLLVVIAAGGWGILLMQKIHRQTTAMAVRTEAEASLERRRSRILENINGTTPLAEIIEQITDMVSCKLDGAPCCCQIADGARLGMCPPDDENLRIVQMSIRGRSGPLLGSLIAGLHPLSEPSVVETEALAVGAGLATLAIETRRLYSDLLRRSEFDLLTDIQNRFSFDKRLDEQVAKARLSAGIFGLIYVDLDEFKQVNDEYGHQVGDLYLQEVVVRMKHQVRSVDMLARIGGDEFTVLVPEVRNRADVEEIALRIERSFDEPVAVAGHVLHASASVGIAVYPEDALTKHGLLNAADSAMYRSKNAKKQAAKTLG
ncbi:MAG: GGDEF domain-containing protein [Terracidiphilus sp.]|jgi:diguanylate cyclase (GGDEF)-like protein